MSFFGSLLSSLIGPVIGAGASLAGGQMQQQASAAETAQQRRWALTDHKRDRAIYLTDQARIRKLGLGDLANDRRYNETYARRTLDEQRAYDRGALSRVVQDAQKAGINPLTALRGGASAGGSVNAMPILSSSAMNMDPFMASGGGVSFGGGGDTGAMGQAVANAGAMLANFDPFEDQMREVQYETMQAQLAEIEQDTRFKAQDRVFDVPTVSGSRYKQALKGTGLPLPSSAGRSQTPTVEAPTVTNPWPTGTANINPGFVDAQAAEARYGDVAQEGFGLVNLGVDLGGMAWRRAKAEWPDVKRLMFGGAAKKGPRLRKAN